MARAQLLPPLLLLATACSPAAFGRYADVEIAGETDDGSSTADGLSSTSTANTSADATTSTSGGSDSDSATTTTGAVSDSEPPVTSASDDTTTAGDDGQPPLIEEWVVTPETITANGPITVTVTTSEAEGVRMKLDSGDILELTETAPSVFEGEIPALTGLDNGSHTALLTPWRDDTIGQYEEASYTIALPTPGSQAFWEVSDQIGAGRVAALGVLPDDRILEFGTRQVNGTSRCYLRRREKSGAWSLQQDVMSILPATDCEAIDLTVAADGSIFLLAKRQGDGGLRWWLGELAAWGQTPKNRGLGAEGEAAVALAGHSSGGVAVCGTVPTQGDDGIDAAAWMFYPDAQGKSWSADYLPDNDQEHAIAEHVGDCSFDEHQLILVGTAFGKHLNFEPKRDRLFLLSIDSVANLAEWSVDKGAVATQSGATAVAIVDHGRYLVGGYTCDDNCKPKGILRLLDSGEGLIGELPLGSWSSKTWGVHDIAWSPAGYAVVVSGGLQGNETAFTVRAYSPNSATPLWTFTREDAQAWHMAFGVAVGRYGEVYTGGFGDVLYPAIAFIAG